MATYDPVYRVTAFESDGATPLTPAAGAPHSDDFKVATKTGVAGFQPYLEAPKGRKGRLDLLARKPDTGFLSFRTLDQRTTAGGSNLSRWITAFVGDAKGKEQLLGKKVLVERSLTGAAGAFSDFFTGRIQTVDTDGRLWLSFKLRDTSDALKRTIFAGFPNASATGFVQGPLFPLGLTQGYGTIRTVPRATGVIQTATRTNWGTQRYIAIDEAQFTKDGANEDGDIITRSLINALVSGRNRDVFSLLGPQAAVTVTITSGPSTGQSGRWLIGSSYVFGLTPQITWSGRKDEEGHQHLTTLVVTALQDFYGTPLTGFADYLAVPADDTTVEFEIVMDAEPSETLPVFLDLHPWQLVADILDGYWGRLSDGVVQAGAWGSATWSVLYDTSEMASFIADTTWGTFRAPIRKAVDDAREFIEKHIMVPFGGGYFYNPSGEFVPLDLRRPTSIGSAPTFVTNDLKDGKAPRKTATRQGGVTRVRAIYYLDREVHRGDLKKNPEEFPDVPPALVESSPVTMLVLNFTDPDLPENTLEIDALGHRAMVAGVSTGEGEKRIIESALLRQIEELKGPYLAGVVSYGVEIVSGAAELATLTYGQICILDFDEVPDPASNLRGGPRLGRVTEISPGTLGTIVGFVDMGVNVVATVPVIGTLAATTGAEATSIDVPITLNGDSEPAQLEYAVTETSVGTRPVEDSDLWRFHRLVLATATEVITALQAGKRIWVRGRTTPTDADALKIPSAWVFPTGAAFIDLTAIPTPGAVVAGSLTGTTALVAWTNTSVDFEIEVHLVQGGDSIRVDRIAAGSDEYLLEFLDNSTLYTVQIYYVDGGSGGISGASTDDFTTTATDPVCPNLSGVSVIGGRSV